MVAEKRSLSLVKGSHRFVFEYYTGREPELLTNLVRLAQDPMCPLDWFDAAVLSYQLGKVLEPNCDLVG
ncbi:MAG: hypothetical protein AB7N71_08120 [Phycisphaerae bacterium]